MFEQDGKQYRIERVFEKGNDSFGEIAKQVNDFVSENDVVLLKGSNSMELEKIVPMICKICEKNDKKGGC